jgi:hypothetical protein
VKVSFPRSACALAADLEACPRARLAGRSQRGEDVDHEDQGVVPVHIGRVPGLPVAEAGWQDEEDPAARRHPSEAAFPAGITWPAPGRNDSGNPRPSWNVPPAVISLLLGYWRDRLKPDGGCAAGKS